MKLVSIIVPSFNQAIYLTETLNSVKEQTYTNWECIIINDGSTDETENIAEQFVKKDKRFRYVYQKNRGLSNARNNGISQAKGEFIQFLDSDDLLMPNKLKQSVDMYNTKNTESRVIYYASMRYFEDFSPKDLKIVGRDKFIGQVELKEEDSLSSQKELIFLRNPFVISAAIYPLTLFKDVGNFDENLKALEDWDFHIRCNKAGYKFHHFYEKSSLTYIRLHNESMMRNQKLMDINFYQLIEKHNLRDKPTPYKKNTKDYIKDLIPPIFLKIKRSLF